MTKGENSNPNNEFFDKYLDVSSRINALEQFKEYTETLLRKEHLWFQEEAHVDLEIEFSPLFSETFPPILHSSVIISSIILLENEIKTYSNLLKKYQAINLSLNDLSGSLLEKFKKFVGTLAGLDFDFTSSNWQDVKGLYEIRNCLVHNGGSLDTFSKIRVIQDFYSRNNVSSNKYDILVLDVRSSKIAITIISTFVENIYASALRHFPGNYRLPIVNFANPK